MSAWTGNAVSRGPTPRRMVVWTTRPVERSERRVGEIERDEGAEDEDEPARGLQAKEPLDRRDDGEQDAARGRSHRASS